MTVLTWIGVALVAIASCSALAFSVGFLRGMRHESIHHRYRDEDEYLGRGAATAADAWDRAADLRDSRAARKNSAGIYDRPWRLL